MDVFRIYADAYYSKQIQPAAAYNDWPGTASPSLNPAFHTTVLLARVNECWCVPKGTRCAQATPQQRCSGWLVFLLQGIGDAGILAY